MAGLARLNLNGFLKILTFVSSQAPLIYLTPQFRFLQQVYILATLKFRYCAKAKKIEKNLIFLTTSKEEKFSVGRFLDILFQLCFTQYWLEYLIWKIFQMIIVQSTWKKLYKSLTFPGSFS